MKEQDWTEQILNSIDKIQEVQPNNDLLGKILKQIEDQEIKVIPINWVLGIAASFLLLIGLNFQFVFSNNDHKEKEDGIELVIEQFDQGTSNQLY